MSRFAALLGISALALLLLATSLFASSRRGVWDPDEPRYAQVSREMLESHDASHWIVPHLDGREYTAKPPLLFWLESASASLTGGDVTPLSARLPSALSGVVVLLATAALGLRLLGPRGAVAACLALLAQGQFIWQSSFGQIDQLLAAFEVSGTACIVLSAFPEKDKTSDRSRRFLAGTGLALLGLGVLAKGPVSVLVPLLSLGLAFLIAWTRPRLGSAWVGLSVGLLPAIVWYVAASRLGSPECAVTIGWKETVVRYFSTESHVVPAWRLWVDFAGGILPVGLVLFAALGEGVRAEVHAHRFKESLANRLPTLVPLAWLVATLVFFSFSRGKRSVYLVPTYPAVALLVAWWVERPRGSKAYAWLVVEHAAGWVLLLSGALVVPLFEIGEGFIPWLDWELEPCALRSESILIAFVLGLSGALLLLRSRAWLPVLGLGSVVVFAAVHVRVVPAFDPVKSAERASQRFLAASPPESEWAVIGEEQEGILFYSRKRIEHFERSNAGIIALHAWLDARRGKPCYVIVRDRYEDTTRDHFPGLKDVARVRIGDGVFALKR